VLVATDTTAPDLITSLHLGYGAVAVSIAVWPFLFLPSHVLVYNFVVL
jgi:hypothetical protein